MSDVNRHRLRRQFFVSINSSQYLDVIEIEYLCIKLRLNPCLK